MKLPNWSPTILFWNKKIIYYRSKKVEILFYRILFFFYPFLSWFIPVSLSIFNSNVCFFQYLTWKKVSKEIIRFYRIIYNRWSFSIKVKGKKLSEWVSEWELRGRRVRRCCYPLVGAGKKEPGGGGEDLRIPTPSSPQLPGDV